MNATWWHSRLIDHFTRQPQFDITDHMSPKRKRKKHSTKYVHADHMVSITVTRWGDVLAHLDTSRTLSAWDVNVTSQVRNTDVSLFEAPVGANRHLRKNAFLSPPRPDSCRPDYRVQTHFPWLEFPTCLCCRTRKAHTHTHTHTHTHRHTHTRMTANCKRAKKKKKTQHKNKRHRQKGKKKKKKKTTAAMHKEKSQSVQDRLCKCCINVFTLTAVHQGTVTAPGPLFQAFCSLIMLTQPTNTRAQPRWVNWSLKTLDRPCIYIY